jgi:predicted dithiol-disulfide oxidoreductase (DUF899 family)
VRDVRKSRGPTEFAEMSGSTGPLARAVANTRCADPALHAEKEHTRQSDELARRRRRRQELRWVAIEKGYVFETDDGEKTLAELFDGRSQLLVYHFMFGFGARLTPERQGCTGCSLVADHFARCDGGRQPTTAK